jgi:hypothetical protein
MTYLRDLSGNIVHSWTHTTNSGFSTLLAKDGSLIRSVVSTASGITGSGATGLIEAKNKAGTVLWSFAYKNASYNLHHYIEVMPNGHVLGTAWEVKSQTQALLRGVNSSGDVWPDHIIEIAPPDSANAAARIVWEWHMWDHLVPAAQAAANPRRFSTALRATGSTSGAAFSGDWPHFNGISYDSARDEIAFSSRAFNEFYVIDHGTTTAQAADSVGGKKGRGGDLLYRWGAAANYGVSGSQYFDVIHAVKVIPPGYPGAGNYVVINNREGLGQTHCVEVKPPREAAGGYSLVPGSAFGPAGAVDTFTTSGYYHVTTGSAQRLPNGNTMCVESDNGLVREWDSTGALVWSYTATGASNNGAPSAFKYAPDHPGILALLGTTPVRNPLLHKGLRPDVRRVPGFIAFRGMSGARIEVYAADGRRRFSGVADSDDFRWAVASARETYFVRIRRAGKSQTLTVAPGF